MLERSTCTDGRREATQTTLLWRCRDGLTPTWRSSPALQEYSENLSEVPADQPGKLERPRLKPTYVEENREDRRSNLRSQPHHHRQSQTLDTQISTATAATASQHQRPTASNVPTMSTDIPGVSWTCWTHPDQMQHSDFTNHRLPAHLYLASHVVN
nr:unnamed protein product [Spirometra erinaceieuropaei]